MRTALTEIEDASGSAMSSAGDASQLASGSAVSQPAGSCGENAEVIRIGSFNIGVMQTMLTAKEKKRGNYRDLSIVFWSLCQSTRRERRFKNRRVLTI